MFYILLVAAALAADDPDPRVDALEAQVRELQDALQTLRMEQFMAEANALAATAPAPMAQAPASANAFNPRLTAFGDVLTSIGIQDGAVLPESTPWLRSLELDLRADVDPYAKAVAVFAVEQEPPFGEEEEEAGAEDAHSAFTAAPEEVYVDFVSLPGGLSARVGAFRQSFGVVNRAHPHDWPWPDAPAANAYFLGDEGYADVGGQVTWRVPNPFGTGISLTGGAMSGALLDPEHLTAAPEWIARGELFHRVGIVDFGVGGSGTGLGDQRVLGGDLMVRLKVNSWRSVVLLVEAMSDADVFGGYASLQIQPTRPFYLGIRGDYVDGQPGLGAYASFYTSEFLRIRSGATVNDDLIAAHTQLTFVWGSHPVEPYWVNR